MVVGIDVCHSGSRSVVGFTASVNREMSQYFRAYFYQPKCQELIKDRLREPLRRAIQIFKEKQGARPHFYAIFRDGVGDQ